MKFKVGDRVQRGNLLLKGEIVEVLKYRQVRDGVKYGILWEYPSGAGWGAELEEDLEPIGSRVVVPRALLEEVQALLKYVDGLPPNWDGNLETCRTAIGLLLESK